jgi:hypothetical protein
VKRLSQTLHWCFFCALDDILDENWLIMVDGGGGAAVAPTSCDGLGKVREVVVTES